MSTAPDPRIRSSQAPQAPVGQPPAAPQAGGSPWAKLTSGPQSNRNLFIVLGVAGAVLFFCLTFALMWFLIGGDSRPGPGRDPMFPDDGKGGQPGVRVPPNPGVIALKPRDAVNGFLNDLHADRVEDAYRRTSRGFQLGQTPEQFRQYLDMRRALKRYTSYELRPLSSEAASVVMYQGKVTGGPYGTADFTIEVVKEDNGWVVREFVAE